MRLRGLRKSSGKCFAWLPTWTDEGLVWLEWLYFRYVESWGWGSCGTYVYSRFIPLPRYYAGERVNEAGVKSYATPPGDPRIFCRNFNPDGPTPCHYPHCLVGGIDNCEVCIGRDVVVP